MPAPVASTPVMFGRLPTVLVPGLLCTPQLFMAQLPLFWTQGSVTVADTTRHGEIGAMARAILADAPPVFRLVGLSMGGYLAFEILRQAPERVGELVLFDTSARADTDEVRENRLQMIRMAQNGGFGRIPSMFPRLVAPGRVDDLQLAALVEGMRQAVGAEGFVRQQMAILGRPDSRPLLAKIDCRTLVVVGEGDQLTPPALAQGVSSGVPGAKLAIIPGAGHLAPMERPEAVNAVLQRWLSQA